jgi:hypothetical protein
MACRSWAVAVWVGAGQARDYDAAAGQLEGGGEQVGERERHHLGQRTSPDLPRLRVLEVRRQLVKEDQYGLVSDQLDPIGFGRRLWHIAPEPSE